MSADPPWLWQTLTEKGAEGKAERGTVTRLLAGKVFEVRLANGHQVRAHLGGRMRLCPARLLVGDRVLVQVAAFDPGRGRILRRLEGD